MAPDGRGRGTAGGQRRHRRLLDSRERRGPECHQRSPRPVHESGGPPTSPPPGRWPWGRWLAAWFDRLRVAEANIVMVFLAAVAWVAFRYGRGPAIWASVISVLVFDVFFVPPGLLPDGERHAVPLHVRRAARDRAAHQHPDRPAPHPTRTRPPAGTPHPGLAPTRQAIEFAGREKCSWSGAAGQHLREMTGGEVAIYLAPSDAEARNPPAVVFGDNTDHRQAPGQCPGRPLGHDPRPDRRAGDRHPAERRRPVRARSPARNRRSVRLPSGRRRRTGCSNPTSGSGSKTVPASWPWPWSGTG